MDQISIERIVNILACMYGQKAEAVVELSSHVSYLFLGTMRNRLFVSCEEIDFLLFNGIIEQDGGSSEPGHETEIYVLTSLAQDRIKAIIENNKSVKIRP
jgi:hypothetical protein